MSVSVALENLRGEVDRFGPAAYLITVSDDGRPHTVSVSVSLTDGALSMDAGTRTAANAEARSSVTMLWPPIEPGGYSLIVDGTASAPDPPAVRVTPTRAVLHRSAESGASDCVAVYPTS